MSATLPEGPFYRCGDWIFPLCPGNHSPSDLRFIKGGWRCFQCFADGFGRDVLHEWDAATTLQEYLEGRDG